MKGTKDNGNVQDDNSRSAEGSTRATGKSYGSNNSKRYEKGDSANRSEKRQDVFQEINPKGGSVKASPTPPPQTKGTKAMDKYLPYDIYDHCMEKPKSVQSLLFSQIATNPNAFKLSNEAVEKIEKRSDFKNKLLAAIEYALKEKLVQY